MLFLALWLHGWAATVLVKIWLYLAKYKRPTCSTNLQVLKSALEVLKIVTVIKRSGFFTNMSYVDSDRSETQIVDRPINIKAAKSWLIFYELSGLFSSRCSSASCWFFFGRVSIWICLIFRARKQWMSKQCHVVQHFWRIGDPNYRGVQIARGNKRSWTIVSADIILHQHSLYQQTRSSD